MPHKSPEQAAADLRREAEERLARQPAPPAVGEAQIRHAMHELQVHQIELQMQNEALRVSEAQAQDALRRLAELNASMEERIDRRTAELVAALDAAEAANRAKSAFLSNMSHELRTPMNGVIGMVELALRRATDEKQRDWLAKARGSAQHLLAVINDILDLSKIEAEQMRIERAEFSLGSVVQLVNDLMLPESARRGLDFKVEIDAGLASRPLRGDRQRLGQVLVNLTGNALKFTDQGGVSVHVTVEQETRDELAIRFEVRDSGIGIAAQHISRLFHSFQQIDDSMSRNHGGSGLGLAISARMVQLMGGQIGVETTLGAGSTFWFVVPLGTVGAGAQASPAAEQPQALTELMATSRGVRILLVEDNVINQEVLRGLLEGIGMTIDTASDGAAAVDMAQSTPYAVILMDVQLPRLSGIDATRAIRRGALHSHTPIIALTASVFSQDRMRCIQAGMDDHLAKPVVPEVLYSTLLKWLQVH